MSQTLQRISSYKHYNSEISIIQFTKVNKYRVKYSKFVFYLTDILINKT